VISPSKNPPAVRNTGIFQNQFFYQISVPGGEDHGPWDENFDTSPTTSSKPELRNTVDVMTVSEIIIDPLTLEECRLIQIYQHKTEAPRWDLQSVQKYLLEEPEQSLLLLEPYLQSPKSPIKFFSKRIKCSQFKDFVFDYQFLQPLFGSWLNPKFVADDNLETASALLFLVEYCVEHGMVVRPLKPSVGNLNRTQLREIYAETINKAIASCIAHHPGKGFSLAIASPLGTSINCEKESVQQNALFY
jgi:hypothetical protein